MAKSAKGRGSDFGHGSAAGKKPAPQARKGASMKAAQATQAKFSKPR